MVRNFKPKAFFQGSPSKIDMETPISGAPEVSKVIACSNVIGTVWPPILKSVAPAKPTEAPSVDSDALKLN